MPRSEQKFRERYKKSPSFLSIHMGVKADALPQVGSVAVPCCLAGLCTLAVLQVYGSRVVRCRSACLRKHASGGASAPLSCLHSCVSLSMPVHDFIPGKAVPSLLYTCFLHPQAQSNSLQQFAPAYAQHTASRKGISCRAQRCTTS